MSLKKIFSKIIKKLDELDQTREEILKISREMIRDASRAIKNVHRGEFDSYEAKINALQQNHAKLLNLIDKNPGFFFKHLRTPEQEYTEAVILYSIITKKQIPTPSDLNVDPLNYVLGLADVIGELRRYALDNIRKSKIDNLNEILEYMDEIYSYLFSLDYPSGLTQDLRHKTDKARLTIERTRGDVSLTIQINKLKECIEKNIPS